MEWYYIDENCHNHNCLQQDQIEVQSDSRWDDMMQGKFMHSYQDSWNFENDPDSYNYASRISFWDGPRSFGLARMNTITYDHSYEYNRNMYMKLEGSNMYEPPTQNINDRPMQVIGSKYRAIERNDSNCDVKECFNMLNDNKSTVASWKLSFINDMKINRFAKTSMNNNKSKPYQNKESNIDQNESRSSDINAEEDKDDYIYTNNQRPNFSK